jgi:hypothetical protein
VDDNQVVQSVSGAGPASPWPFLVVALLVIVLFFGSWTVMWLRSDRRRSFYRGPITPPPWDNGAVCVPVKIDLKGRSAKDVAERAIRNAGATEIQAIDDQRVIGWIGREWGFRIHLQASRQGYELGIATATSNGVTEFLCCARPQLALAVVGTNRIHELATMLAGEVHGLATEEPPTS